MLHRLCTLGQVVRYLSQRRETCEVAYNLVAGLRGEGDASVLLHEPEGDTCLTHEEADGLEGWTLAVVDPVAQAVGGAVLEGDHVVRARVSEGREEGRLVMRGQCCCCGHCHRGRLVRCTVHAYTQAKQLVELCFRTSELVLLWPVPLSIEEHDKLLPVEAELHCRHTDLLLVHSTLHLLEHPLLRTVVLLLECGDLFLVSKTQEDGHRRTVTPLILRDHVVIRRGVALAVENLHEVVPVVLLRHQRVHRVLNVDVAV